MVPALADSPRQLRPGDRAGGGHAARHLHPHDGAVLQAEAGAPRDIRGRGPRYWCLSPLYICADCYQVFYLQNVLKVLFKRLGEG